MKIIRLKLCTNCNVGTAVEPKWEDVVTESTMPYSEENLETAKVYAYNGEYSVEETMPPYVLAPKNILTGEYITIDGVLYLAMENIPNGESVIVGQNAIATTVEEQLYVMKGE